MRPEAALHLSSLARIRQHVARSWPTSTTSGPRRANGTCVWRSSGATAPRPGAASGRRANGARAARQRRAIDTRAAPHRNGHKYATLMSTRMVLVIRRGARGCPDGGVFRISVALRASASLLRGAGQRRHTSSFAGQTCAGGLRRRSGDGPAEAAHDAVSWGSAHWVRDRWRRLGRASSPSAVVLERAPLHVDRFQPMSGTRGTPRGHC